MQNFNILDRSLTIHQHYLLEASAGTGKTFSIQHLIVRLLIEIDNEQPPYSITNLLVVTFTRAATRDLRFRIHTNIKQSLYSLRKWLVEETLDLSIPDYLQACIEKGSEHVKKSCKYLEDALFTFDQAPIFTIHAFCARMLRQYAIETNIGLHVLATEQTLPQSQIIEIVRNFFRTEIRADQYSPTQLAILLKEDPHQYKLLQAIQSGHQFFTFPSFQEAYTEFTHQMTTLKQYMHLSSEKMVEDFRVQAPFYRNYTIETKAETLTKIVRFANLFEQDEWSTEDFDALLKDTLVWVKALQPNLLKKTVSFSTELSYPNLTEELSSTLYPLIEKSSDFSTLLARIAKDCQKFFHRYQKEEEKLSPDDVLRKMKEAVTEPAFCLEVQRQFQVAIIDEFQDTDPLQWNIFQSLFLSVTYPWKGYLYLVGDPKQSIYSFRQADIYTYLAAAKALGEKSCFSLGVNFRSQPFLVQALNLLFSKNSFYFIPLPKQKSFLSYKTVQAAPNTQTEEFEDSKGAIHFIIEQTETKNRSLQETEADVFFPFIVQEIIRLRREKGFDFRQFAVLVRDRHQALRLADFFEQMNLPYMNQRKATLIDSPALHSIIHLLRATLHLHDKKNMRLAMSTPLIGWTYEDFKHPDALEKGSFLFQQLKKCLTEKGFSFFLQELFQTICFPYSQTILTRILSREGGHAFYRDLQQIADLVIDHQYQEWNSPEGIIPFLERLQIWDQNDDPRIRRMQDPTIDGIHIVTLHFSKGLEFDVVFALGIANRSTRKEHLIPIKHDEGLFLSPIVNYPNEYQEYCEEEDAEKIRQLYVTLTRAKYQLYIPIPLSLFAQKVEYGEASPLDLFFIRTKEKNISYSTLYEKIREVKEEDIVQFLVALSQPKIITYSLHKKIHCSPYHEKNIQTPKLTPSPSLTFYKPSFRISSFSSLASRKISINGEEAKVPLSAPSDYECIQKTPHTLPSNAETGLLIHQLLEKIPMQEFKQATSPEQILPLTHPFLQGSRYKTWKSAIAALLFQAVKTPLQIGEKTICIAELEIFHLYREIPFLFPYHKSCVIEEIEVLNGLIKGVIDFIFYEEGRYYLVDWKTNWLGACDDFYQKNHLQQAMKEHFYFLQAALYKEALKRYIAIVDRRSFDECFGGIFYLFVRGMNVSGSTGILKVE